MSDEELQAMLDELDAPVAPVTPIAEKEAPVAVAAEVETPKVDHVSTVAAEPETKATPAAPVEEPVKEEPAPSAPAPAVKKSGTETMLNRFIDYEKAMQDLVVNERNLDEALMNHASLYAHYAIQSVNARRQYDRLKSGFEVLEATLDNEFRASMSDGAAKKPTEGAIHNAMVADRRWSSAQARVIEAGSIWRTCEVIENAMCQRKDLILESARDRRKEKEGQVRVLENQNMRDRVMEMIAEKKAA